MQHPGATQYADTVMVNGKVLVRAGRLVDERLYEYIPRGRKIAARLVQLSGNL